MIANYGLEPNHQKTDDDSSIRDVIFFVFPVDLGFAYFSMSENHINLNHVFNIVVWVIRSTVIFKMEG